MNSMMNKRRPEKTRQDNETPIIFADINTARLAQVVLKKQGVQFRVSGLSLYVAKGTERLALAVLCKENIKMTNLEVEQIA